MAQDCATVSFGGLGNKPQVLKDLKEMYNIEETTFAGNRGMITKLNLDRLIKEGYGYIMGVKTYHDEICQMLLTEEELSESCFEDYQNLKIQEKRTTVKTFLKWKMRKIGSSTLNRGGK